MTTSKARKPKAGKTGTGTRSPVRKSTREPTTRSRTGRFDVFISYSHGDSAMTKKIHEELRDRGVNAWIDFEQIKPGDLFVIKMEEGLACSSAMILIVSPRSMRSNWVEEEYLTGISRARQDGGAFRLIPVLIDKAKLPPFLSNRAWVDLRAGINFNVQLDLLAQTILGGNRGRSRPLAVSGKNKKHLEHLSFMIFFPEGILELILNSLLDSEESHAAMDWAGKNGYLQTIRDSSGLLIRIDPEKTNAVGAYLPDKPAAASRLIGQLIDRVFLEQNPFEGVVQLGFGRALLLRDLIEMAEISGSDSSREVDLICSLARDNLRHVIDEELFRVAADICEGLDKICGFTSPKEVITKANLLGRIGQSRQAVQLFDLYRGDNLYEDSGLDVLDRIAAAMNWARAVKESGAAGHLNDELTAAYAKMLALLDPVIASSKGVNSLLTLKADILNNRATQIGVYGTLEEWKQVRGDFKLIISLYTQTGSDQRLIGAVSNHAAHTVDRSENKPPYKQLLSGLDQYNDLAGRLEPCEELFFYYYQKARLFKRGKPDDPTKAIELYKTSHDVALAAGLKRRYPIAKRWELVLRRRRNDISENDFLKGLSEAATTLREQTQDSWALNSLCDILVELAQTYKVRGELKQSWGALQEVYLYRTAQFTYSGSQTARQGIVKALQEMDNTEVSPKTKVGFIEDNNKTLNKVMGFPQARILDWNSIHQWLGKQG